MLFNSLSFAVFLPVVFLAHWLIARRSVKLQNSFLLVASYVFYASWDYRFLGLLIGSTLLDYITGQKIFQAHNWRQKKIWLLLSIIINLGLLGAFKYFNFFIESFAEGLEVLGLQANVWTLQVILPVGISFYTFHGLSYVLDIYHEKIQPETNLVNYALFVSFFPLLVAGPIERATHFLPQLQPARKFDYSKAVDGLRQILWGLLKKVVIADTCAKYVNIIFDPSANFSGSTIALGAIFFAIQIYCDFSGYSDIALGTARLFGINLLQNFSFPYFSRNIAEFWRRWHISLTSWFRDYLYIPLGGSKHGKWMTVRNILIVFLMSGLWHGANWTFIVWGLLNALYLMPAVLWNKRGRDTTIVAQGRYFPTIKEFISMSVTFSLVVLAWIVFRADSLGSAIQYFSKIFSVSLFTIPEIASKTILLFITGFILIEWLGREQTYAIAQMIKLPTVVRWLLYIVMVGLIFYFFVFIGQTPQFIYFQF